MTKQTDTMKAAIKAAKNYGTMQATIITAIHDCDKAGEIGQPRTPERAEFVNAMAEAMIGGGSAATLASAKTKVRKFILDAQSEEWSKWIADSRKAKAKGESASKPPKTRDEKARAKTTAKAKNTNPPKKGGARGPQTGGSNAETKDPADIIRNQLRTDVKRAANHAQNQAVAIAACLQTVGGLSGKDKAKALAQLEAIREHNTAFADDMAMLAGSV